MGIRNFPVVTIGDVSGLQVGPIAAASARVIPTTQNGGKPKYLWLRVGGPTPGAILGITPNYGASAVYANAFPLVVGSADTIILNVHGFSHIGYDVDGVNVDVTLYLYPLEDF